ncbi:uncharacterized protein LOC131650444 [Vicia villosa]|uniref:uncharacterized protein LOC131606523 n=1 Tax=Vicia villosa TaxID=3911 RepID=UPI00273C8867|nr:uncharacterized protein LOC131606523 [Vicia villosa]XP_058756045.1 uncharacterized protein LOC131629258 [Vicia villosa]XP_058776137.1 uncharacterized protein LOC131650444 [Vicia villosa]
MSSIPPSSSKTTRNIPPSSTCKEDVRFCMRPSKSNYVKIRLHHRGQLVESPCKWYVNGLVSELDWEWDTDYMSYMDLEASIKDEGYINIKCRRWDLTGRVISTTSTPI